MGELTLNPGESKKIVSQPDSDEAYNINVKGAEIYVAHRSHGIVREGKHIRKGDRTVASNLRGKPLYAKNPSTNNTTATVEVDQAGFALTFQTRRIVEQPSDAASRENQEETAGGEVLNIASGSYSSVVLPLSNTTNAELSQFYAAVTNGNYSNNVWYRIVTLDSGGSDQDEYHLNGLGLPHSWKPRAAIPEDGDVKVEVHNESGSVVDVQTQVHTLYGDN